MINQTAVGGTAMASHSLYSSGIPTQKFQTSSTGGGYQSTPINAQSVGQSQGYYTPALRATDELKSAHEIIGHRQTNTSGFKALPIKTPPHEQRYEVELKHPVQFRPVQISEQTVYVPLGVEPFDENYFWKNWQFNPREVPTYMSTEILTDEETLRVLRSYDNFGTQSYNQLANQQQTYTSS
eukprot:Trichotokara_eunicae@DN2131_c0_g1_i1.p1